MAEEPGPSRGPGAFRRPKRATHVTSGSLFYDRIVPLLLIGLVVVTLVLILVSIGFLLGVIPWH